jgi:hypothetical protein
MHGGYRGAPHTPGPRQVQTGLVEMNDVEVVRLSDDGFQSQHFVRYWILTLRIEAQRLPANWHQ